MVRKINFLNNKGITIVWLALGMLVLLIMFAGLALDIAYMYNVKNQLTVAADAGSLAGAGAGLSGNDTAGNLIQEPARQAAWKFACKNSAAGSNVYLVTNVPADCNTPPPGSNLNSSNASTGDIVVGNWTTDNSGITCATGWEAAGSGFFCRANGTTGLAINAIKAVARRSADGASYGMGAVSVFWGKVFGWAKLSAVASAIATGGGLQIVGIPLCLPQCGTSTPLLTVSPNTTPGTRFFLKKQDGPPIIGWTAFFDPSSANNVSDYILGNKQVPPICNQCIMTNNGVMNPTSCDLRTMIESKGADYTVNGTSIHGWKVLVPILDNTFVCSGGHEGCIGDPGYQPNDPFKVTQMTIVILTDSIPASNKCGGVDTAPGNTGIVIVGTGAGVPNVSSTISCLPCNDPAIVNAGGQPKLVK